MRASWGIIGVLATVSLAAGGIGLFIYLRADDEEPIEQVAKELGVRTTADHCLEMALDRNFACRDLPWLKRRACQVATLVFARECVAASIRRHEFCDASTHGRSVTTACTRAKDRNEACVAVAGAALEGCGEPLAAPDCSGVSRDMCILEEAKKREDPRLCELREHHVDRCIADVAVSAADFSLCETGLSPTVASDCFSKVADAVGTLEACSKIPFPLPRANCEGRRARDSGVPSDCARYEESYVSSRCYENLATQEESAEHCGKITSPVPRDRCFAKFGRCSDVVAAAVRRRCNLALAGDSLEACLQAGNLPQPSDDRSPWVGPNDRPPIMTCIQSRARGIKAAARPEMCAPFGGAERVICLNSLAAGSGNLTICDAHQDSFQRVKCRAGVSLGTPCADVPPRHVPYCLKHVRVRNTDARLCRFELSPSLVEDCLERAGR